MAPHLPVHPCTVLTYWWVNISILYATPHSDSIGMIPNQYSVVYKPSSLQHSSAKYIVWSKVTQPVSGGVRILTWISVCKAHVPLLHSDASGHRLTILSFIWSYHLTSYMTVGKLPIFSIPNFHHLLRRNNGSIYFIVILWGLHEVINPRNSAPMHGT